MSQRATASRKRTAPLVPPPPPVSKRTRTAYNAPLPAPVPPAWDDEVPDDELDDELDEEAEEDEHLVFPHPAQGPRQSAGAYGAGRTGRASGRVRSRLGRQANIAAHSQSMLPLGLGSSSEYILQNMLAQNIQMMQRMEQVMGRVERVLYHLPQRLVSSLATVPVAQAQAQTQPQAQTQAAETLSTTPFAAPTGDLSFAQDPQAPMVPDTKIGPYGRKVRNLMWLAFLSNEEWDKSDVMVEVALDYAREHPEGGIPLDELVQRGQSIRKKLSNDLAHIKGDFLNVLRNRNTMNHQTVSPMRYVQSVLTLCGPYSPLVQRKDDDAYQNELGTRVRFLRAVIMQEPYDSKNVVKVQERLATLRDPTQWENNLMFITQFEEGLTSDDGAGSPAAPEFSAVNI